MKNRKEGRTKRTRDRDREREKGKKGKKGGGPKRLKRNKGKHR